jgi:anti-sigma B factor antagonist
MKIETERQASVTILTPAVRRLDASVAVAFKAAIAQEIGESRIRSESLISAKLHSANE